MSTIIEDNNNSEIHDQNNTSQGSNKANNNRHKEQYKQRC